MFMLYFHIDSLSVQQTESQEEKQTGRQDSSPVEIQTLVW